MTYDPKPLDTQGVSVDPIIEKAIEKVAAHLHDLWATRRIKDGWQHGASRNDETKEHPCLVPYDDLPDSEKEYDRDMASGTIWALLAMGYRIVPPREG